MKIALVGAFDRNNYGDILMPIVMKKQIEREFKNTNLEFKFYGLSSAQMQYTGGYDTEAFSNISTYNPDVVIFVGGEILTSKYTGMYLNLQKSKLKIFYYKCMRRLFYEKTEKRTKKLLKCSSIKPWIVNKKECNCKKLIYNTVGGNLYFGTDEKNKDEVEKCIRNLDYISVREKSTFEDVKKINKCVKLYPDSVIAISNILDENLIQENVSNEIKDVVEKQKEYFVFQINNKQGKNNINQIVNQIKKINKETGLNCILLPIGYAQGHEDQIVLNKIYKKLDSNFSYIPKFNNIYETIHIIKNSKLYIGTSLHGAITAISYNIPHIALTSNIKKLVDFLSTWKTTPIIKTEISDLYENVNKLLEDYNNAEEIVKTESKRMKELVNENFKNINDIIRGENNE